MRKPLEIAGALQTFAVSDVALARAPLAACSLEEAIAARLSMLVDGAGDGGGRAGRQGPAPALEACGANQARLVHGPGPGLPPTHPVIEAVHTAFAAHYPLVLSPDDVWLCLAQGFALHVETHAEALRSRFVQHEGKLKLTVVRDEFVKGSPDNDWQGCFAEWSDAIAAHVGKKRDLVVASFSTTGPIERAASELVLMSALQSYFDYELVTRCGIPQVTLLGTLVDWRAIRRRAEVLAEFDLGPWVAVLLPVLDQLVTAAAGNADRELWRSLYKLDGGSGGPYVTGWINVLFPYVVNPYDGQIRTNEYALCWSQAAGPFAGTTPSSFPHGMSCSPLVWDYLGREIQMTLGGGFVGISQDPATLAVRPAIGWAVWEAAPGA